MSAPDFLVHDEEDTVGVVVTETVKAGASLKGLAMEPGFSASRLSLLDRGFS